MANTNSPKFKSTIASQRDLEALQKALQSIGAATANVINRVALLEHAVSNIVNDVYYAPEEPDATDVEDVGQDVVTDHEDGAVPGDGEGSEEARERHEDDAAEWARLEADAIRAAEWANEGGQNTDWR